MTLFFQLRRLGLDPDAVVLGMAASPIVADVHFIGVHELLCVRSLMGAITKISMRQCMRESPIQVPRTMDPGCLDYQTKHFTLCLTLSSETIHKPSKT